MAKPDREVPENARGVRDCQFSYFFTKPVDLFTLKTKYQWSHPVCFPCGTRLGGLSFLNGVNSYHMRVSMGLTISRKAAKKISS